MLPVVFELETALPARDKTDRVSSSSDWLTLWHQPGLGPAGLGLLLQAFNTPSEALRHSDDDWRRAGLSNSQINGRHKEIDISADLDWLAQDNCHLLTLDQDHYPERLRDLVNPPPLLYVLGDLDCLQLPQLAIVGSRNPTNNGLSTAKEFSAYFAKAGLTITSGLAMGIDAAAHQASLDADGYTVAVVGTGLDRTYPAKNHQLAKAIAAKGALVSEFPIGTRARAENFPRRNRIISGLSIGTLVVEAAQRSGSLITARLASEQGREIFAIPGSIHNPLARGCHRLIREGAKLVETAEDVIEELGPLLSLSLNDRNLVQPRESKSILEPEQSRVLAAVGFDPTAIDSIISESGLAAETVSANLAMLEVAGYVTLETGGYYVKTSKEQN